MHIVDHIFIALLFVVLPIYDTLSYRRYISRIETDGHHSSTGAYRETIVRDWVGIAIFLSFWVYLQRPLTDLGLQPSPDTGFWISLVLVLAAAVGLFYSSLSSKSMSEEERLEMVDRFGALKYILPSNQTELKYYYATSVTAGIVEEILYRAFAIWYLTNFMPVWLAAIVSSLFFGAAHLYQGLAGAARCGGLGLVLAGIYLLSGSIWLPILAHILCDSLQGPMFVRILKLEDRSDSQIISAPE